MSKDPYHAVQAEIQSSLQAASNLRASYLRIRDTAGGRETEEVVWTRDELKGTLAALEADLEDLEGSVKMVEDTGPRLFGLEEGEVMSRRRYVNQVKQELEKIRFELLPPEQQRRSGVQPAPRYGSVSHPGTPDVREDEEAAWSREEQQMMIHRQDQTLSSISGTLDTLTQQAGLIGQETEEQNELLDDLGQSIDRTDTKLSGAMKKMRKFIRETEGQSLRPSSDGFGTSQHLSNQKPSQGGASLS